MEGPSVRSLWGFRVPQRRWQPPLTEGLWLSMAGPVSLAFATFVGLGGDDIPKTILSICLGLVFAAVGFDQISGAPRLVFFDISGFLHGINFLVLAIGVYGIGEMLWTLDTTRGKISSSEAKMSFRGVMNDTKEGMKKGWKGTTIGSFLGFFVGILPAAGATPGSLMSYWAEWSFGVSLRGPACSQINPSSFGVLSVHFMSQTSLH